MDPSKKTILFAGGVNINHYFDMYQVLIEQREKVWRESFNLVVRPYPHVKLLGSPAWWVLEELFRESGAYISNPGAIDASDDRTAEYHHDLAFEDGPDELNYLLRYSDVMVNYFSTVGLEAAICDLPTIHVGFDPYTFGLRFSVTTGFLQRQTHNRRPLRLAAARVAKNEKELFNALEDYLCNPALDRDARRVYAESECGELDGKSGLRLVNMIRSRV
jgi:CDP-glycerol glycerophosphotransferase (TagB/SpsB family)